MSATAALVFAAFVASTLSITWWAARRTRSRIHFYAAGAGLSAVQNGVAFAGEFLSAATFLGITGLYFTAGYDGLVYSLGALMGMPVLLFIFAEPMKRLGRYTFTDVLAYRLQAPGVRVFASIATAVVLLVYMIAQLVGAGLLVKLLFGIRYEVSVAVIAALMMIYVGFGGMLATSWIQILKCSLLGLVGCLLAALILNRSGWSVPQLLHEAVAQHKLGNRILGPVGLTSPGAAISAFLTQAVGLAGLPHLVMRFFTVRDEKEARRSANYATVIIGSFYLVLLIIGYGAVAILTRDPRYTLAPGVLRDGANMAPLYLAHALGGDVLLGICAAAVFATIVAVVAGLTLAVAASISHDFYAVVLRQGRADEKAEMRVSRIAAFGFAIVGTLFSILFKDENVTFLVVTALSIAASSTFPLLFLCCFWRKLSAEGAIAGGTAGLVSALVCVALSPTVWVSVLGHDAPVFPYQYPTIVTLPIALVAAVAVSLLGRRTAADAQMDAASR